MKSYRKELWFNAPARMQFTNITPDVRECLAESGIKEGLVLINAMHITGKKFEEIKIVSNGAGAASIACIELLKKLGVKDENASH